MVPEITIKIRVGPEGEVVAEGNSLVTEADLPAPPSVEDIEGSGGAPPPPVMGASEVLAEPEGAVPPVPGEEFQAMFERDLPGVPFEETTESVVESEISPPPFEELESTLTEGESEWPPPPPYPEGEPG